VYVIKFQFIITHEVQIGPNIYTIFTFDETVLSGDRKHLKKMDDVYSECGIDQ
jgi:hypothetical protein